MPAMPPREPGSLELRDLQSSKSIYVPVDGLTIGREGGDAQLQLPDKGISRRHARIFEHEGAWFVEDLGSANGTFVDDQQVGEPFELAPGQVISISDQQWEVLGTVGTEMGESEQQQEEEPPRGRPAANGRRAASSAPPAAETRIGAPEEEPPPEEEQEEEERLPAKATKGSVSKPQPKPAAAAKPNGAPKHTPKQAPAAGKPAAKPAQRSGSAARPTASEAEAKGIGYFFVAVPIAFGYYLKNVPLMLFNPMGTIRKGVEEQPAEPMGRMELIAYALPANLLTAAVGFLCTLILQLVTHTLSIMGILPIVPLIVAVVASVITGIIWHPLLNWFVHLLRGESDERSRTNYFLMMHTAIVLTAIPNGVGVLLGLVPLPLIGVVPVVLSLAASLITMFVAYKWFVSFQVVKWFQIVLLVLMALSGLSALAALPGALRGHSGVSVGDIAAATDAADGVDLEALQKEALALQEKVAKGDQDAIKRMTEISAKMAAKAQAAGEAGAAAAEEKGEGKEAAEEPKKAEKAEAKPAPEEKKPEKAEKPAEKVVAQADVKDPPMPPPPAGAAPALPASGYPRWHVQRTEIEKAIENDPTLLERKDVKELYREIQTELYSVTMQFEKDNAKKPAERRVNEHLANAEMYKRTNKQVGALYTKLFK